MSTKKRSQIRIPSKPIKSVSDRPTSQRNLTVVDNYGSPISDLSIPSEDIPVMPDANDNIALKQKPSQAKDSKSQTLESKGKVTNTKNSEINTIKETTDNPINQEDVVLEINAVQDAFKPEDVPNEVDNPSTIDFNKISDGRYICLVCFEEKSTSRMILFENKKKLLCLRCFYHFVETDPEIIKLASNNDPTSNFCYHEYWTKLVHSIDPSAMPSMGRKARSAMNNESTTVNSIHVSHYSNNHANKFNSQTGRSLPSNEKTTNNNECVSKFHCQICFDMVLKTSELILGDVKHEICTTCFRVYLSGEINRNRVVNMHCPHCSFELTSETIKAYTTNLDFNKYQKFLQNDTITKNPLLRWCPNAQCGKIIKLTSASDKKGTCEDCQSEVCAACNLIFHGKEPCDKFIQRELQEWSKNREVRKCPMCRMIIEKTDGCNHMTCQICKYQWCWVCGGTYSRSHFSLFNPFGCPFFKYGGREMRKLGIFFIFLYRFLILLGLIIALPFLFPGWFVTACYKEFIRGINCCFFEGVLIVVFLLIGLILNCFVLAAGAVAIIPYGLYSLIRNWIEARNNRKQAEQMMKFWKMKGIRV